MINEPNCSIGPASLNFFEQHLCVGPRNRQAGDRGYVLPKRAIRILIRREPRGCGIPWIHGEELNRSTLDGVRVASRAMWVARKVYPRSEYADDLGVWVRALTPRSRSQW